ncbi:unnamed protein product, partial [Sphacelaria rigidula]
PLFPCNFPRPITGVVIGLTYPGGVSIEGKECKNGAEDMTPAGRRDISTRYLINQILVLIQLIALLAVFLKPLVVSGPVHNPSAMAVYKRIFVRNAVCTAVVIFVLVGKTIVIYGVLGSAKETQK